jgi:hypothetical protein
MINNSAGNSWSSFCGKAEITLDKAPAYVTLKSYSESSNEATIEINLKNYNRPPGVINFVIKQIGTKKDDGKDNGIDNLTAVSVKIISNEPEVEEVVAETNSTESLNDTMALNETLQTNGTSNSTEIGNDTTILNETTSGGAASASNSTTDEEEEKVKAPELTEA